MQNSLAVILLICIMAVGKLFTHVSMTKQCNLIPTEGQLRM